MIIASTSGKKWTQWIIITWILMKNEPTFGRKHLWKVLYKVSSVLGTAQVFPVTWEKYSDLLPGYTLNNCIIYLYHNT
jgi:hypothetical protein